MQLVLLVSSDCSVCAADVKKIESKYAAELKTEEVAIYNIDESEDAKEFWVKNNLPTPPVLVLLTEEAKYVATLKIDEIVNTSTEKKNA